MRPWKNHGLVSDKKLPPVGAVYDRAQIIGLQPVLVQIRNIVRGHRPRLQGDRKTWKQIASKFFKRGPRLHFESPLRFHRAPRGVWIVAGDLPGFFQRIGTEILFIVDLLEGASGV